MIGISMVLVYCNYFLKMTSEAKYMIIYKHEVLQRDHFQSYLFIFSSLMKYHGIYHIK